MKRQEKNIQTLMSYGIDEQFAEKIIDKNLTITKIRVLSKKDLLDLGFDNDEITILKERIERQPIDDLIFQKLISETELNCCICQNIDSKSPVIIHHIVEYSVSQDNSFDNLIVLCLNCHGDVHTIRQISQQNYPKEKLYDLKNKFINALKDFRAGLRVAPGRENRINDNFENFNPAKFLIFRELLNELSHFLNMWHEFYCCTVPLSEPKSIDEFLSISCFKSLLDLLDLSKIYSDVIFGDEIKTLTTKEFILLRLEKRRKKFQEIFSEHKQLLEPDLYKNLYDFLQSNFFKFEEHISLFKIGDKVREKYNIKTNPNSKYICETLIDKNEKPLSFSTIGVHLNDEDLKTLLDLYLWCNDEIVKYKNKLREVEIENFQYKEKRKNEIIETPFLIEYKNFLYYNHIWNEYKLKIPTSA